MRFLEVTQFLVLCMTASAVAMAGGRSDVTPSAAAVFDQYVRSRGGQSALERLPAIERIGSIVAEIGLGRYATGPYHTCIRYPDRIAIEIDAGVWQLAQTLKRDGAFECEHGYAACKPAAPDLAKQLADTARFANKDFLEEAGKWRNANVSLSGDGTAWRLTLADGKGRWAEFDRAEGQLRWEGSARRARRYGDWRVTDGISIPFRLEDYQIEHFDRAWRSTVQLSEVRISDKPSAWCIERFGQD